MDKKAERIAKFRKMDVLFEEMRVTVKGVFSDQEWDDVYSYVYNVEYWEGLDLAAAIIYTSEKQISQHTHSIIKKLTVMMGKEEAYFDEKLRGHIIESKWGQQ